VVNYSNGVLAVHNQAKRLPTATRPVVLVDELNAFKTRGASATPSCSLLDGLLWEQPLGETRCSNQACPMSKLDNGRGIIIIKLGSKQFLAGRSRPDYPPEAVFFLHFSLLIFSSAWCSCC
jgi:hypothetical protein